MKKTFNFLGIIALAVIIGFAATSCLTYVMGEPINFDDSLTDEQVAKIKFIGDGVGIVEYNGIPVDWKTRRMGGREITIPGGTALFILNGKQSYGTAYSGVSTVTYNNIPFAFKFENGKLYTMFVDWDRIIIYRDFVNPPLRIKYDKEYHIVTFQITSGGPVVTWLNGEKVEDTTTMTLN